ncbi:MAG: peptidoglycan recognition family protein [Acidobacteria bacterium]|nr:peptidoglycan recognition family protein [Acidobacteriota bacterium]
MVAPLLEWRAQRIHDPVQKLKYLRQATTPKTVRPANHRPGLGFVRRNWHFHLAGLALIAFLIPSRMLITARGSSRTRMPAVQSQSLPAMPDGTPNVWQVEKTGSYEVYSNGLRLESEYATANEPRSYYVFERAGKSEPLPEPRFVPAGIVYHTTESHQAPFEQRQTHQLKKIGRGLLDYVRQNRCYNFVIDRFGRVFRVVQESDAAYHAGKSVWADSNFFYVNLNHSFLGIAFEAQTSASEENPVVSPAQIHAARVLTEMLRSRYKIPVTNCVTHAQVSVNPSNMRIGYHTDWAGNFPFADLGLTDNYVQPLPSLYAFGFGYDPSFLTSTGARLWKGLELAETQVQRAATASHRSPDEYRKGLQKRYREMLHALESRGAEEDKS